MKKLTQKFGLYAVATLAFVAVLFLNIEKNNKGEWEVGIPSSFALTGGESGEGDDKKCFVRTTSNCPVIGGVSGGQRVTCDLSGTYVENSTCTPVKCTWGAQDPIECPPNS